MKSFRCHCGCRIYFENSACTNCGRELAYLPWCDEMAASDGPRSARFDSLLDGVSYSRCTNDVQRGVCNWLLEPGDGNDLCQACRLNRVIPDLSDPENRKRWATMETAKRRLLYSINRLSIPRTPPSGGGPELRFDIKADEQGERVVTGHSDGLITLNLAEADPSERETTRQRLEEDYRTPLGHFRHEVGHYYWQLLVDGTEWIEPFRDVFGDERTDYAKALEAHYSGGSVRSEEYVSAYASSHPWEDWAETFAHYLHMIDSLDTAHDFGLTDRSGYGVTGEEAFLAVVEEWGALSIALNALNRSMGMPDAYPFAISPAVRDKLVLVHRVVTSSAAS